jgi:hypothetical protein
MTKKGNINNKYYSRTKVKSANPISVMGFIFFDYLMDFFNDYYTINANGEKSSFTMGFAVPK